MKEEQSYFRSSANCNSFGIAAEQGCSNDVVNRERKIFKDSTFTLLRAKHAPCQQTTVDKCYIMSAKRVLNYMYGLWLKQSLCDVAITSADHHTLYAHKLVIGAYSQAMNKRFIQHDPLSMFRIELTSYNTSTIIAILKFFYTTDLDLNDCIIDPVIGCSGELGVEALVMLCKDYLSNCCVKTALYYHSVAQKHGLTDVECNIYNFICDKYIDICKTEQYLICHARVVREFAKSDKLNVSSELNVFSALLKWIKYNCEERLVFAPCLIPCVRMQLLTPEELATQVEVVTNIFELPQCQKQLCNAYKYHALKFYGSPLSGRFPVQTPRTGPQCPSRVVCPKATVKTCTKPKWVTNTVEWSKPLTKVVMGPKRVTTVWPSKSTDILAEETRANMGCCTANKDVGNGIIAKMAVGGQKVIDLNTGNTTVTKLTLGGKTGISELGNKTVTKVAVSTKTTTDIDNNEIAKEAICRTITDTGSGKRTTTITENGKRGLNCTNVGRANKPPMNCTRGTDAFSSVAMERRDLDDTNVGDHVTTFVDMEKRTMGNSMGPAVVAHTSMTNRNIVNNSMTSSINYTLEDEQTETNKAPTIHVKHIRQCHKPCGPASSNFYATNPNTGCNRPNQIYVVAVGGIDLQSQDRITPGRSVYRLGLCGRQWVSISTICRYTHHHGVVAVGSSIYIIGGIAYHPSDCERVVGATNTCFAFNWEVNIWTALSTMHVARAYLAVVAHNGQIYAVGGEDNNRKKLDSVECYSITSNCWSMLTHMPFGGKIGMSAAILGNKLYIVGGYNQARIGNPVLDDVECYDLQGRRWLCRRPLELPRCHANLVTVNSLLYLVAGRTKLTDCEHIIMSLSNIDVYDEASDTWNKVADLAIARHDAGCTVVGNKIYVFGGMTTPSPRCLSSVECYDVCSKRWNDNLADLPYNAAGVAGCSCLITNL